MTLAEILANTPVQLVAGEMIVYHNNTHLSLGKVVAEGVQLSDAGVAYFAELAAPTEAAAQAEINDAIAVANAADGVVAQPSNTDITQVTAQLETAAAEIAAVSPFDAQATASDQAALATLLG